MENHKKTFIVLGAAGDIGTKLCRLLKESGANLMLAGRDEAKLEALACELGCNHHVVNACNWQDVDQCFEKAISQYGRVDGAANCVGSILLKPAHLTSQADFASIINTNLGSAFACVSAAAKNMRKDGGSVVLVSSAAAKIGLPNHEAIAAAKAGIEGLMLSAAATYARQKIRFNCVAPGLVETKLTEKITANQTSRQSSLSMHPLGRLGNAEDIAQAIAWLLSDESSWVTGQTLAVDGGLSNLKTPPAQKLGE